MQSECSTFQKKLSALTSSALFVTSHVEVVTGATFGGSKESYSRVNDSKQQLNSFIIYDLDSIARVNERKKEEKKK